MARLIEEVTGSGGPVTPFVRAGRSKVAVSWMAEGGREVSVPDVSQRSRLERVLADPKKAARQSGGSVTVSVWEEGHPDRDWRADNVLFSIQYGMDVIPQMYVEIWAPLDESTAVVSSAEAWVRGWGARFGGGWAQLPDPDDPNRPGWHPYVSSDTRMMVVLSMGMVDPVVVGPSWLMVFRPGTFSDDVVPTGLERSPQVSKVIGPDGEYTVVTLAEDARSVDQVETDRWLGTLGPLMDPVLQDPMAALELHRAFTARRRAALAEQDGGVSP
ncbi:MAG: hypothetical protein ACK5CE_10770 [Actinomycetes bacterium]